MSSTASNIAKGIVKKLAGGKKAGNFKKIPWVTEKLLKHQDDQQEKTITIGNITASYKRPYELLHTYNEIFGKEIYQFRANNSTPLIIDCGSNIGMSVLYFKQLYPKATVIAFEPDESNFKLLQKNVSQNNLQEVELHQSAIWIENGPLWFAGNSSEASHITGTKDGSIEVKGEKLAGLLAKHSHIDFLKIDIEGAEYDVVKNCAPYLKAVQHMFLEYHGKTYETAKLTELLGIVRDSGFSLYVQNAADNLSQPFVNKTTPTPFDVQLNLYCYKTS